MLINRVRAFFLHPSAEQIAAWVDGFVIDWRDCEAIAAHLVNCERCAAIAGGTLLDRAEEQLRSDEA